MLHQLRAAVDKVDVKAHATQGRYHLADGYGLIAAILRAAASEGKPEIGSKNCSEFETRLRRAGFLQLIAIKRIIPFSELDRLSWR
ncbi:hypothetical protein AN476_22060 [Phaeobacter sp. 11ANDIMAR09]|nr:hypothetical protein AN476_22060 [Phaeobacter sp. 11ANDIMAR09]